MEATDGGRGPLMNRGRPEGLQACPAPERAPWAEDRVPADIRIVMSLLRVQFPDCAKVSQVSDTDGEVPCERCLRLVSPYRLPSAVEST
jgi:hypothetical protein